MALSRRMQLMVMYILLMFWVKAARANDEDRHRQGLKMKAVSVYFNEINNVTAYLVVQPPDLAGPIATDGAPFGSLFLSNDRMTEGADPASAVLGNVTITWFAITPGFGPATLNTWTLTFFNNSSPQNHELQGLHGTLSASGLSTHPQPITGGTGSFAFAVGSLTLVPINITTFNQIFRLDLLLYWPPYTPHVAPF